MLYKALQPWSLHWAAEERPPITWPGSKAWPSRGVLGRFPSQRVPGPCWMCALKWSQHTEGEVCGELWVPPRGRGFVCPGTKHCLELAPNHGIGEVSSLGISWGVEECPAGSGSGEEGECWALCPMCHHVLALKHSGAAAWRGDKTQLWLVCVECHFQLI